MIDFDYWFKCIVSTCELIASRDAFERTWLRGDYTITSIHYPAELFEQLLGDLDMEECVLRFSDQLRASGALEPVSALLDVLLDLEKSAKNEPRLLGNPAELLASQQWST